MVSELLSANPDTRPITFLQLTWSAGDHIVARGVDTLADLAGKKIVLQQGGPHVGLLDDALKAARLSWNDVNVVWVDELTGAGGPAERFRNDPTIDVCLVISPDMIALTGGLNERGSGGDGTVKDARVLVSTAQMSRSIADVYAVRKDFYESHRKVVEQFAAGYLKATEQLVEMKKAFDQTGAQADYQKLLGLTQQILGKDVLPTADDTHGLISDAFFVGLPGNVSFFNQQGNLSGFDKKQQAAVELAAERGYAGTAVAIAKADLDYGQLASVGTLKTPAKAAPQNRFAEMSPTDLFPDDPVERKEKADDIILTFTISFQPNQSEFSADQYGDDFQRTVEAASTFGNAAVGIGGHSDPTLMLRHTVEAGMEKGILTRTGSGKETQYRLNGKPFDLNDTHSVITAISAGTFSGTSTRDPNRILKALDVLSKDRADAVKKAIVDFAASKGLVLDASQLQAVGIGPREPKVPKPTNMAESKQNMRVWVRLIKVASEAVKAGDFNF
jgi:outer membrane protein OmpA-like peptidoglycan-associated protein